MKDQPLPQNVRALCDAPIRKAEDKTTIQGAIYHHHWEVCAHTATGTA